MNKTFALLAAFALMFAVAGCPKDDGKAKDPKDGGTTTEKKEGGTEEKKEGTTEEKKS